MPDRQQVVPCASDGMDNCWIYPQQPQCVKYICMSVYMYVYVHICICMYMYLCVYMYVYDP